MGWLDDAIVTTKEQREEESKQRLIDIIESQRKKAEDDGVTIKDVRYGGDKDNRQYLSEAVQTAKAEDKETFDYWKDSNGKFIKDHPVSEVENAITEINKRRLDLISKEGEYVAQVETGDLTDADNLEW